MCYFDPRTCRGATGDEYTTDVIPTLFRSAHLLRGAIVIYNYIIVFRVSISIRAPVLGAIALWVK